jgi:hypothetical protein
MFGLSIKGLINLLNVGYHIVEKPPEKDRMERCASVMTLWYQDCSTGEMKAISLEENNVTVKKE